MISARSTLIEFQKPIVGSYSAFITDENFFERVSSPMLQKGEDGLYVHDTLRLKVSGAIGLEEGGFPDEVYVQVPVGKLEIHTNFGSPRYPTILYRRDSDDIPDRLTAGDLALFREGIHPYNEHRTRGEAFRYHRKLVQRVQEEFLDHEPTIAAVLHWHDPGNRILKVNSPSRILAKSEIAQYFP